MTISMATQSTIPVVVTIQVLVTDWNSDWNKTDNEESDKKYYLIIIIISLLVVMTFQARLS